MRFMAFCSAVVLALLTAPGFASAASGPSLIKDINPYGSSNPTELTRVGSTLFFAANDGVHGNELWKSDGTTAGTKMVKDIRPYGKSSDPENLVNVNGTLFFTARDGVHGRELWKSNGTAAGTKMVKDIQGGSKYDYCGNDIYMPYPPVAVGNRLFFVLHCGGVWSGVLYVSDGTAAGTFELDTPYVANHDWGYGEGLIADSLGGRLYFVVGGDEGLSPQEIWVSDGTNAGTHRMAGSPTADNIAFLPAHGTKLYFLTSRYNWENENLVPDRLWRTDGTAAGTKPLTAAGQPPAAPTMAVLMNSRLYFNGGALWKTDGTVSGTKKISNGELSWLTSAGGKLYFTRDTHLWRSAGTAASATDMGQFGVYGASHLIGVGTELCFAALGDNETWTLWESNGSVAGTYQVKSFVVVRGYEGWDIQQAALGSKLFFAADDGVHGAELWSYTP